MVWWRSSPRGFFFIVVFVERRGLVEYNTVVGIGSGLAQVSIIWKNDDLSFGLYPVYVYKHSPHSGREAAVGGKTK